MNYRIQRLIDKAAQSNGCRLIHSLNKLTDYLVNDFNLYLLLGINDNFSVTNTIYFPSFYGGYKYIFIRVDVPN